MSGLRGVLFLLFINAFHASTKITWKRFGPCTVGSKIKQINLPMNKAMRTLIQQAKAECEKLSNCVGFQAIQDGTKKQANLMSSGTFKNPPHDPETTWCWQKVVESTLHMCHPKHPDQKGNQSGCCGKYGPCPAYMGDCNSHAQCEGDLKCNIADKGSLYGYSNNAVDVCGYDPPKNDKHMCAPDHPDQKGNQSGCCGKYGPCPAFIGDCNSHAQCEGDLKCNIADKGNLYGYSNNHVDVCGYDPPMHMCHPKHPAQKGNDSGCCAKYGPCPLHFGDCNKDSECEGDLKCNIADKGNTYGYSNNHVDVCGVDRTMHKCHPKHPDQKGNDSGCCAKYGPCPLHFGDCNKDSECEGDLKCNIADKGNTYGYSNNYVDVCGSAAPKPVTRNTRSEEEVGSESNDCAVNNGGCSHECRMAGNGEALCSCPNGYSLLPDGHDCVQDFADCVAEETNLHTLLNNNLAGLGPDDGGAHDIEYGSFYELEDGTMVKLKVTAQDSYAPYNVKYNGIAPGGEFGQVGIVTGSDVTLKFELLDEKTNELVDAIPEIAITFYDLDTQRNINNAQESVRFCGAEKFKLSEGTTIKTIKHENGCSKFAAQKSGGFKNNPKTKAELTEDHMNNAVTATFRDKNEFFATLHATKAGSRPGTRNFIFSIDVSFCEPPRCVKPMHRPERYLEITPIMRQTNFPAGMFFQYNKRDAENFFETRPKWNYFGEHMMMNSCGETKMLTIMRNAENCDIHDNTLECGRFTGDGALFGGDWSYHDFDNENAKRWIAWPPGEEPPQRKCVDVVRPERHLIIHPIVDERAIEHAMYFEYDKKEAENFFQTKPKWKYSGKNIELVNSCGETEKITIIRGGTSCTKDKSKAECGRITGFRAGFDDWDYVHSAGVEGERWLAFPDDVVFVKPEVSVGFGFGLFQKNCPNYNRHECCGKRDNRHIQFGASECVIARNGRFRSGHECEPLSWAQKQDAANIGSCRTCSNNPHSRVGNSCMCNNNYCNANQFCYNGRCNSAAQIPNCMNDGDNPISTQCYCGGNNRCPAGKYCYDGHCRNSGRGPVCCRAYTASCMACAQGVSESWYCTNNCDVPGCESYCYTEPVVVRSVRNNRADEDVSVGSEDEVSVGFGFGLFQKNCPDYNRYECCGKTDNRHIQFGASQCVTARNGVFRSGNVCEPLSWAQREDAANIGSCRTCSNNPHSRVGNSCMCNGNYCNANQFCYNGRCNSGAQRPVCCKAYTANCLACAQGISKSAYCANNCGVPGCQSCYTEPVVVRSFNRAEAEVGSKGGQLVGGNWNNMLFIALVLMSCAVGFYIGQRKLGKKSQYNLLSEDNDEIAMVSYQTQQE